MPQRTITCPTTFATSRQEIAGVSIADLAKQYGTPTYVYDMSVIEQRVADLAGFGTIRYAQKACSNIAILDRLRKLGVVVDAVSAGEIGRAMRAGYVPGSHPADIVYTADVFDKAALDLIVQHNIPVNIGSPDMINQLGEVAPGRNITLRINPGFGHGHSQKTNTGGPQSKHGIWHEQVDDCLRRADRYGLIVSGVHMHIGSGTDLEHLSQVCAAMESTCLSIGRTVTTISAGGGLPCPIDLSKLMSISIVTMRSGMLRAIACKMPLVMRSYGDRTGALPGSGKRFLGGRDSSRQADGTEHFLSARCGL